MNMRSKLGKLIGALLVSILCIQSFSFAGDANRKTESSPEVIKAIADAKAIMPEASEDIEYFFSLSPAERVELLQQDANFPAAVVTVVMVVAEIAVAATTVPLMDKLGATAADLEAARHPLDI